MPATKPTKRAKRGAKKYPRYVDLSGREIKSYARYMGFHTGIFNMNASSSSLTPQPLTHLGGTQIAVIPDMHVAPGQQWIAVENTPVGRTLIALIGNDYAFTASTWIICPHTYETDRLLVELVDVCAKLRLAAPHLVQLELALEAQ